MVLSNGFFYERIQLDTINERFNKVPTAKEGDANGRGIIVVLTENGLVKNTTGVSLLFKWEHTRIEGAQGLEDFEPLDLTNGEYIVTYPTEMNHEGYVKAEIRIIENGKYAGSRNMKIQVEPSVGDDTAMESSNQFSALVTALLQVNSWNTTIDGKIVEWEDDMAATKQLYIDNMEEVEATYPQELLSITSQLAEKVDKAATDLTINMFTESDRAVLQGLEVGQINAVLGIKNVRTENVADKAITLDKINADIIQVDESLNLLNPDKLTVRGYFSRFNGAWTVSSAYLSSDYIKVTPNAQYTKSGSGNQLTFWDIDGNFVSGVDLSGAQTFTVPNNNLIHSARFPFLDTDINVMFVSGSTLPVEFIPYFKHVALDQDITLKVESDVTLARDTLKYVKKTEASLNVFDKAAVTNRGYFKRLDGSWVANNAFAVSYFITAVSGDVFSRNSKFGQVTYYDINKVFVSGTDFGLATIATIPTNVNIRYVRFNINILENNISEVMIVRGSTLPAEFIPYRDESFSLPSYRYVSDKTEESKSYLTPEVEPFSRVVNPIITKAIVTDRTTPTGVADPFIVFEKGCYHMFFEVLGGTNPTTLTVSDEIGHAYSYNLIDWTYTQIVLSKEEKGHRSAYPNVFKFEDEWYMIPDAVSSVYLYKATNFPLEWESQGTLLDGSFVDTNIFKIEDVWYMTTSTVPANSVKLYYNDSGDWRNRYWKPHPSGNIIAKDSVEKGKRNAGKIFHGGDYIIMPLQITPVLSGIYGEYTDWYKLYNITKTSCEVAKLGRALTASGDGLWNDKAMHHISHVEHSNGTIYAADGLRFSEYSIGLYVDK